MQDLNLRPPACRNGHAQRAQSRKVLDMNHLTTNRRSCKSQHTVAKNDRDSRYWRIENGTRRYIIP
jgi:hypothetical protein